MANLTPGTWNLDSSHSEIGLTVRHAGISKVRAIFEEAEATLVVSEGDVATVDARVKAASFNSKSPDRDAHVRGEDFLDSEKHPELTFVANNITASGEEFEISGDLSIRGVTKPVTFEVEFGGQAVDPFGMTRAGFSANTVISRKEFGLTWNAALEAGGVLVGDKVSIDLEAAFVLAQ
ncbi:YceI family protein [Nesterenkonia sp. E16_7]|uniref:YceI family protein n=1 Tax=unclassified Nesterenkonia TaxID=2629769 RepID=UPI001A9315F7|nr:MULTISPECIES: YceI family protein [unclassified Nesterenkonia]MBO0595171.1 YceI family protein [Nesterenkonia sp. E16_10]MBO0598997.1 YceI family protein [Nesterenkonia sp. E16_7]